MHVSANSALYNKAMCPNLYNSCLVRAHTTYTQLTYGMHPQELAPARPAAILCRQPFNSRVVGTVLHIGISSVIRLRTRDTPLPVAPETQAIDKQSRHDAKLVSICNQSAFGIKGSCRTQYMMTVSCLLNEYTQFESGRHCATEILA